MHYDQLRSCFREEINPHTKLAKHLRAVGVTLRNLSSTGGAVQRTFKFPGVVCRWKVTKHNTVSLNATWGDGSYHIDLAYGMLTVKQHLNSRANYVSVREGQRQLDLIIRCCFPDLDLKATLNNWIVVNK